MKSSRLLLAALPLLLIAVPGCVGDDAGEGPASAVTGPLAGIPMIPLGAELADTLGLPPITEQFVSFEVQGATDYLYEVEKGRILLSFWDGSVHRVIYQTPIRDDATLRDEKNQAILDEYAMGMTWDEGTESEGGTLYMRSDGRVYAFWNPEADYMTVGTTAYRANGG